MSFRSLQNVILTALLLAVVGCASGSGGRIAEPSPHYKVGSPYQVNGRWYQPAEDDAYDKIGVASWYGRDFHGRKTANGEVFDMNRLTAAHTTLPMPSLVEVENLENGRRIVVRINDRGPFASDRIIDLSRAAARELGFEQQGLANVRVRYVGPAALPGQQLSRPVVMQQPARKPVQAAPVSVATGSPASDNAAGLRTGLQNAAASPPAPTTLYLIRIAALSNLSNIDRLRAEMAPIGPLRMARVDKPDGAVVYRINMGPYADENEALERLEAVRKAGYGDASLIVISS